jgi:acetylornithine deacetylase/succinyl-diaminopimelate desuccinylase-like protein
LALASFTEQFGTIIASPGIAEKGSFNVRVEVTAPGGHSSIPPPHTVFVILLNRCLHSFIATTPAEYWHPLCAPRTLRAESLQSQTCQSITQTIPS